MWEYLLRVPAQGDNDGNSCHVEEAKGGKLHPRQFIYFGSHHDYPP